MNIDKVITLANRRTEVMLRVMVRSLRAVGCDLPVLVIPYDDERGTLPEGCEWLENESFYRWVDENGAHPMMRKYLPFTMSNYQYLDTDAIFLKNPATFLEPYHGFVASCTEWNKPLSTVTQETLIRLTRRWSTWQKEIFSAGQFACDRALYTEEALKAFCELPGNHKPCLGFPRHDQPGANLLVLDSDVPRLNLTLAPWNMDSSYAGDYVADATTFWKDEEKKPYLLHYAGGALDHPTTIRELYFAYLTVEERAEWEAREQARIAKLEKLKWPIRARLANAFLKVCCPRYHVQRKIDPILW